MTETDKKYRTDDLQHNGLVLMQDPEAFCFGCDAVELANFVAGARESKVCDLGAGNGIISVLLAAKRRFNMTAVEIQYDAALLCKKNAELNGLTERISVVNLPMQEFIKKTPKGGFDIVVTNPPYQKTDSGENSAVTAVALARHELAVTLSGVIECAAHLVKFGGKFYMVYPSSRLAEALYLCSDAGLEPKVLQMLTPDGKKPPHLFLLECISGGKKGLKVHRERAVKTYV